MLSDSTFYTFHNLTKWRKEMAKAPKYVTKKDVMKIVSSQLKKGLKQMKKELKYKEDGMKDGKKKKPMKKKK
jgi:hypothetical protein